MSGWYNFFRYIWEAIMGRLIKLIFVGLLFWVLLITGIVRSCHAESCCDIVYKQVEMSVTVPVIVELTSDTGLVYVYCDTIIGNVMFSECDKFYYALSGSGSVKIFDKEFLHHEYNGRWWTADWYNKTRTDKPGVYE